MKRPAVVLHKRSSRKKKISSPVRKPKFLGAVQATTKPEIVMADEKKSEAAAQPATPTQSLAPTQFAHKNPPIGPTTGKLLADWNQFRDYENFNPSPNK
jgi:hypothetical protein